MYIISDSTLGHTGFWVFQVKPHPPGPPVWCYGKKHNVQSKTFLWCLLEIWVASPGPPSSAWVFCQELECSLVLMNVVWCDDGLKSFRLLMALQMDSVTTFSNWTDTIQDNMWFWCLYWPLMSNTASRFTTDWSLKSRICSVCFPALKQMSQVLKAVAEAVTSAVYL